MFALSVLATTDHSEEQFTVVKIVVKSTSSIFITVMCMLYKPQEILVPSGY